MAFALRNDRFLLALGEPALNSDFSSPFLCSLDPTSVHPRRAENYIGESISKVCMNAM